jgi:predicted Zn finger-like uncharacterized protein
MTVSCPDCRSVFRVDPAKVPATGVRARCSVCGGVIAIAAGTLQVAVTPGVSHPPPHAEGPRSAPVAARASSTPATLHGARAPSHATPQHLPYGPFTPAAPATSVPSVAAAIMTPPAPAAVPGTGRAGAFTPSAVPRGAPSAAPAAGASATHGTPAAGKRPINPFLNADPGQRARRLARALVSDLVAYHPQKREEGLRDGTLRQLFREEIKKSYEEFVEQVGRELADSSPHFQDALNDILGGGRKLF